MKVKAVRRAPEKIVFVCYEENSNKIAATCGRINGLEVYGTEEGAIRWFYRRLGVVDFSDDFIVDKEDEKYVGDDSICEKMLRKELERYWEASTIIFRGWQGNVDECYTIKISKEVVEE